MPENLIKNLVKSWNLLNHLFLPVHFLILIILICCGVTFRYLRHKEHLPVMELRFGDTGTIQDTKSGEHRLGPLRCTGDSMSCHPALQNFAFEIFNIKT